MSNNEQKELFAFVLMPFNEKATDNYKLAICGAAKAKEVGGINAERLCDQFYDEGMLDRIQRQIKIADIIIADLTDKNPNVFYELGYAHAKKKLCLLITQDAANIPFDLKHKPHIIYSSVSDLKTKLISHLKWAKKKIHIEMATPFTVASENVYGFLNKNNNMAKAEIQFAFKLKNETNKAISFEAIYFYTGNRYSVTIDSKTCYHSTTDESNFKYAYYLETNKNILPANGWMPLSFKATKILARAWEEDLKDEYQIKGRSLLKFITDSGPVLHKLSLNIIVSDVPF